MASLLPYLLAVQFLLLLLVGYYRLFLARQRRFQWNRVFLLGGMAAALVLPTLRLDFLALPSPVSPAYIPQALPALLPPPVRLTAPAPATPLPAQVAETYDAPALAPASPPAWSAWEIAWGLYAAGVALSFALLLFRNGRIVALILRGPRERRDGYTLVANSADLGPASYFRYIFWPEGLDPESAAVALAHERCHSRQLHTLDLLAVELLRAVCWFNPAVYLLRQDLRRTHEYLADQAALPVAGPDGLQRLLLQRQLGTRQLQLANYFHSHTKARITMLKSASRPSAWLAYLSILPLAGLMAACTSFASSTPANSGGGTDSTRTATDSAFVGNNAAASKPAAPNLVFDLDDVFVRAQLPLGAKAPEGQGLVCLGEEPPVFRLDTSYNEATLTQIFPGHPEPLNLNKVAKLIGYPEAAKQQKRTATVRVKVLVDEGGLTIRHLFLQAPDPLFRAAIDAHVRDLLFQPGHILGKPAKWWVVVPFYFGEGC